MTISPPETRRETRKPNRWSRYEYCTSSTSSWYGINEKNSNKAALQG
jgi:hypothetical protein